MLTGKQFLLRQDTLALETTNKKSKAVSIPEGAIIKVLSGPTGSGDTRMITVLWEGHSLDMFVVDLETRGTDLPPHNKGAAA